MYRHCFSSAGRGNGRGAMPFLMSFALEHEIVTLAWIDNGAHLDNAITGPRTVPVRSSIAGGKAQECSRPPRPSDVLRAGTARAPVGVSRCARSAIQWANIAPPPASRSEAEETQLRGRTNSPCHYFARALKAHRSLKT